MIGNEAAYFRIRIPAGKRIFEELCSHLFLPIGKVDQFQGRTCHQNSSKIRWQQNSYGILQEFWSEYWWETLGANIRWLKNFSRISIRILNSSKHYIFRWLFWWFRNSEFWLEMKLLIFWSEFQLEKEFLSRVTF